jgi:hypothetical protein
MKHRPLTATHIAPWANTSTSTSSPIRFRIARICASVHSRASTKRRIPKVSWKNARLSEFDTDACVERCTGTPISAAILSTAKSHAITASIPASFAAVRKRRAFGSSFS